jgi:hypothetical protein
MVFIENKYLQASQLKAAHNNIEYKCKDIKESKRRHCSSVEKETMEHRFSPFSLFGNGHKR